MWIKAQTFFLRFICCLRLQRQSEIPEKFPENLIQHATVAPYPGGAPDIKTIPQNVINKRSGPCNIHSSSSSRQKNPEEMETDKSTDAEYFNLASTVTATDPAPFPLHFKRQNE